MIKHYEKYLSVFGAVVVVVTMLGIVYFSLVTYYRHTPFAHTLLGYSGKAGESEAAYTSMVATPFSLSDRTVQTSDESGGCGCPFCCAAS